MADPLDDSHPTRIPSVLSAFDAGFLRLVILYPDFWEIYLEQACKEWKEETKERKQAMFSLSTNPWGTEDWGSFAK